ncbi:hypothetical protein C8F04DRAFT_1200714 [Mycena alexandri]|uniref:Uncharacterized protein n=1 Tax=Mycena alexandri TaxID=1745969 RepID=A0AAD6RYD5_9AGAR|nr:hypothetical protein C8F04DRAFT_1200698 [Mycena alexandri]KAJ7017331.1 hypothetical protein C8F04DRAFT_1200714 [Mycena alexandri]
MSSSSSPLAVAFSSSLIYQACTTASILLIGSPFVLFETTPSLNFRRWQLPGILGVINFWSVDYRRTCVDSPETIQREFRRELSTQVAVENLSLSYLLNHKLKFLPS